MEDTIVWRSPEELVTIGFERSTVVMMNEAHSGIQRCIRTREIGRRILPAAHEAGVRHLAMEALWPCEFAEESNRTRCLPTNLTEGYLIQPEMRIFMQAALDLGWMLIPYEPDLEAHPEKVAKIQSLEPEGLNWREDQEARNIVAALSALPSGAKLLVWCGWSHHAKMQFEDEFAPMGCRFRELSGIEFFGIDQVVTVSAYPKEAPKGPRLAEQFASELAVHGGTAGFLTEEAPVSFLRDREDQDAFILSTQNELV